MKTNLYYNIVKEAIDDFDVFEFLKTGAPDDEYDPEIKSIIRQLDRCTSSLDISYTISRVFNSYFDEKFDKLFFQRTSRFNIQ